MKRAVILATYVAIAVVDAALGQSLFSPDAMVRQTVIPPVLKQIAAKPAPLPAPETVVIRYGQGGVLRVHREQFAGYQSRKTKVEIRGPCQSACTLITAYVDKDNLCIAEGAFLAFHAVRSLETHTIMPPETVLMYRQFPEDIRGWIDRHGGVGNLPLNGFWTMYDRELWAMGYPRCTP